MPDPRDQDSIDALRYAIERCLNQEDSKSWAQAEGDTVFFGIDWGLDGGPIVVVEYLHDDGVWSPALPMSKNADGVWEMKR